MSLVSHFISFSDIHDFILTDVTLRVIFKEGLHSIVVNYMSQAHVSSSFQNHHHKKEKFLH